MNFKSRSYQQGGAYLLLLLTLVLISLSSLIASELAYVQQRRSDEEELIFIGMEFCRALQSYKLATPPGGKTAPDEIANLLADTRTGQVRRHLRKIYIDPITREGEWHIVRDPQHQGILGISSRSTRRTLRQKSTGNQVETGNQYRDWVFSVHSSYHLAVS